MWEILYWIRLYDSGWEEDAQWMVASSSIMTFLELKCPPFKGSLWNPGRCVTCLSKIIWGLISRNWYFFCCKYDHGNTVMNGSKVELLPWYYFLEILLFWSHCQNYPLRHFSSCYKYHIPQPLLYTHSYSYKGKDRLKKKRGLGIIPEYSLCQ